MKVTLVIIVFVFFQFTVFSQYCEEKLSFDVYARNRSFVVAKPSLTIGSHVNAVGFSIENKNTLIPAVEGRKLGLYITTFMSNRFFERSYGIPGISFQGNWGGGLAFGFGDVFPETRNRGGERHRHAIQYFFSFILSSDKTSQPYGGIIYALNFKKGQFVAQLDNDDAYCLVTDKYRTTKGLIGYRGFKESVVGAFFGFNIWTGNLDGTQYTKSGGEDWYALSGYGGGYSHGAIYLKMEYNCYAFSIGYDHEGVRDFIQNGWHALYNRLIVPLVDRKGMLFVSFSFNELMYDY
jgi:hypothetical protein